MGAVLKDTTAGGCYLLLDHMLSRVCVHKHNSLFTLAAEKKLHYTEIEQAFINLQEICNIHVPR